MTGKYQTLKVRRGKKSEKLKQLFIASVERYFNKQANREISEILKANQKQINRIKSKGWSNIFYLY